MNTLAYLADSAMWLVLFMTGGYASRQVYESWKNSLPWDGATRE